MLYGDDIELSNKAITESTPITVPFAVWDQEKSWDEHRTPDGQKDHQREDFEDRSLVYRNWIRKINTDPSKGIFLDVDFIKWQNDKPVAITELTRCDSEEITDGYRLAIIARYFHRDQQGAIIKKLSEILNIPAYLVLYQKEMKWIWVYSFQKEIWRYFLPDEWAEFVTKL